VVQVLVVKLRDLLLQAFVFAAHGLGLFFKLDDFDFEFFDVPLFSFSEGALSVEKCTSQPLQNHCRAISLTLSGSVTVFDFALVTRPPFLARFFF
jgi:hypothetical protein